MKSRRILAILVCLVLVVSMAVVASAATSTTFFSQKADGYQCVGTGSIDGSKGTSTLRATALPMHQIIPGVDCESTIFVLAYDTNGDYIGAATTDGNVNASATYIAGRTIGFTYSSFEFNGTDLGSYVLNAD